LVKGLDACGEVAWALDAQRTLIYLNRAAQAWLSVGDDSLLGRVCHPGSEIGSRVDALTSCLSPPAGLGVGEALTLTVCPPDGVAKRVRILRWGESPGGMYLAWGGASDRPSESVEAWDASRMRDWLAAWRQGQLDLGGALTAGASPSAVRLRGQISIAATTRQPFAIVGPTGCGGERIARRIHAHSSTGAEGGSRLGAVANDDPFVVVDMPLMDAELLAATLSPAAAHLAGNPPGAVTLLLRGVDESPIEIQDGVIEFAARWGESLRVVGLFRTEVAGGLKAGQVSVAMGLAMSLLEIRIDPLASRIADLPLIATALVDRRHAAGEGIGERLGRAATDRLLGYPWPENFDELDAALRQAVAASRSAVIGADDLPLAIRTYRPRATSPRGVITEGLDESLRRFEFERISAAVELCGGNRSEAARRLGISRARLIRRLGETSAGQAANGGPTAGPAAS